MKNKRFLQYILIGCVMVGAFELVQLSITTLTTYASTIEQIRWRF